MTSARLGGLGEREAAARLRDIGPNVLRKPRRRGLWDIARATLVEPMFLLLVGAAVLYLMIGDLAEGLFLAAGAALTIGMVIYQDARSERALAALNELAEPFARVIRDGEERRLPARDLVPGDILLVAEGERLPADGLLISGEPLTIDESILTGESVAVVRRPAATLPPRADKDTPGDDDGSMLLAGTLIVRGQGVAEVLHTGSSTALGRIGATLAGIEMGKTPLQKAAGGTVAMLGALAIAFSVVVVLAYGLTRGDWVQAASSGIASAIALIPEEVPMVLAIFLALGAFRLAGRRVLVRRSAVIETLGSATVLCVDKTGTLTENRMTVAGLWADGRLYRPPEGDAALPADMTALVDYAVLASAVRPTDPMDRAIRALRPGQAAPAWVSGAEPVFTWPLSAGRLAVVQVWPMAAGGWIAAAKGAPEAVFKLCCLPPDRALELEALIEDLAAQGLRILGVASCRREQGFADTLEGDTFDFAGLVGFMDPLRGDVPEALAQARAAGIQVAMITGDFPATAREIARQAGIDLGGGCLTGMEIAALPPAELRRRVRDVRVFARVQPAQKLLLVEAFKANGEVVAMTGDGVNDAPALESAHIGIAMGRRGTDVAREAADLVLLDDSFSSIVGGVRLGRRIYANLRKALVYILAIHLPIAGLALLPVVMGLPPLLFPMHVVLLELIIDPVCSLVFEAQPSGSSAMRRPPRSPTELLFGPRQLALAVAQGAIILAATLALYLWALGRVDEQGARAAAFVGLVVANLTLAVTDATAASRHPFGRGLGVFWLIALGAASVLAIALYLPIAAAVFRVAPPGAPIMAVTLAVGLAAGAWLGPVRWLAGLFARR